MQVRVRSLNCGGATPMPEVQRWLQTVFTQCVVTENYASTEAGAITHSLAGGGKHSIHDSKDLIYEGIELKLSDWGDYKYRNYYINVMLIINHASGSLRGSKWCQRILMQGVFLTKHRYSRCWAKKIRLESNNNDGNHLSCMIVLPGPPTCHSHVGRSLSSLVCAQAATSTAPS